MDWSLAAFPNRLRLRSNHTCGANVRASATVDASFRIDNVDFAFRDRCSGAFVDASAASNAIFVDNVSHCVRI